jgi:hypothetical protein
MSAMLSKEDTHTLELSRQRGRRIRLIAISLGAAILIAFGIKVIVTSHARREAEAADRVEDQSDNRAPARSAELARQPAATAPAVAPSNTHAPEPTAAAVMVPGPPQAANGRARRSPAEPAEAESDLGSRRGGHMRLTTSKLDRLSDRSAEHVVEKPAAGKPAAAPQAAEPVRPPAPTPPAAPASRAGKISIDDF